MNKTFDLQVAPFATDPDFGELLESFDTELEETQGEGGWLWSGLRSALGKVMPSSKPAPVETPGGGRIKDKKPPTAADLVTVIGVGGKRIQLHRLAAEAWKALVNTARADGIKEPLLLPVSGYRSPEYQKKLWESALARYGSAEEARKWVAPPGGSAHQTGRAIDFYLGGRNSSTNVRQLRTLPAYQWLVANAQRFGFYPYEREPWHWEYNPPAAGEFETYPGSYEMIDALAEFEDEGTGNCTQFEEEFALFNEPQAPLFSGIASTAFSANPGIQDTLRTGREWLVLRTAIQSGERDVKTLTNMIFFARHPERKGRKISKDEPGFASLSKEWLEIRDRLVKPALPGGSAPAPAPTTGTSTSAQTSDMPRGLYGTLTIIEPVEYHFSYTFTPEDALWLARLLVGEAGGYDNLDNHAVIWALFNRFALFTHAGSMWMKRAGLRGYPTFTSFIQSYSTTLQPVLHSAKAAQRAIGLSKKNPHKYQYVETGGFYPGTTIPKGQLKHHRDKIQKMTWSSLRRETRDLVERALRGDIPNPIGLASDFANTKAYFVQNNKRPPRDYEEWRKYTEAHARSQKRTWIGPVPKLAQVNQNAFFIDNRVKNLPKDTVRVIPPAQR